MFEKAKIGDLDLRTFDCASRNIRKIGNGFHDIEKYFFEIDSKGISSIFSIENFH